MRALPPRPFLDSIVFRSVLLWAFVRVLVAAGSVTEGTPSGSLLAESVTGVLVCGVVLLALRVELRRRAELLFLANLGVSFFQIGAVVTTTCAALEAIRLLALTLG